jgi:DNA-directed RNA polymerase specialized sigma24 family protein
VAASSFDSDAMLNAWIGTSTISLACTHGKRAQTRDPQQVTSRAWPTDQYRSGEHQDQSSAAEFDPIALAHCLRNAMHKLIQGDGTQ